MTVFKFFKIKEIKNEDEYLWHIYKRIYIYIYTINNL